MWLVSGVGVSGTSLLAVSRSTLRGMGLLVVDCVDSGDIESLVGNGWLCRKRCKAIIEVDVLQMKGMEQKGKM